MHRKQWEGVGTTLMGVGCAAAGTVLSETGWISIELARLITIIGGIIIALGLFMVIPLSVWPLTKRMFLNILRIRLTLKSPVKVYPPDNKLTLVLKAIMEAKRITTSGKAITVYITDSNGLSRIYPQELKDILLKLQDDERIIRIKSFPDWLLPHEHFTMDIYNSKMGAIRDPSIKHFVVETLDTFDKWYKTKC